MSKKAFQLEYGRRNVYAVKWTDDNCDREGKYFFTEDKRDIMALFLEHESHEGLHIQIVQVKPEWVIDGREG